MQPLRATVENHSVGLALRPKVYLSKKLLEPTPDDQLPCPVKVVPAIS